MNTTIVIATADRPGYVLDCLRSLKAVGVPESVEVLVVDAGVDAPVDMAVLQALWPTVRVVKSPVRNAGLQRNLGVKKAAGVLIIFLDDDAIVQPGWWPNIIKPLLDDRSQKSEVRSQEEEEDGGRKSEAGDQRSEGGRQGESAGNQEYRHSISVTNNQSPITNNCGIAAAPTNRGIGAVAGAVWCNPRPAFTDKRGGYINWRGEPIQITHRSEKSPVDVDWPMTTNMAVRKDVFCEIGGFPSVYGIYDEDVDLGLKIRRAGWEIRFVAQAAVYHTYLLRPARPRTKQFMFLLGRNRSILLVRHFGLFSRLLVFLVSGPTMALVEAFWRIGRYILTTVGHVAAYVVGTVVGIAAGIRNPIGRDKEKYDRGGEGEEHPHPGPLP